MGLYGLVGKKLGHSHSPYIHQMLGAYPYQLYEVEEEELGDFLTQPELLGLNITIPYKKAVIKYCSRLSVAAEKIGSVNTIIRDKDGTWYGDNTDYYGFSYLLKMADIDPKGKKVLVFGNGGAALTVCAVLKDQKASSIVVISRSGENNYLNLSRHTDAELLIQTTPVGMYPYNGETKIEFDQFKACEGVVDLIYNPLNTKLILQAKQRGIKAAGGLDMLIAQAKQASELFQHKKLQDSLLKEIGKELTGKIRNIVLIGMPGSGKTTIGNLLASKLGKQFVDTDLVFQTTYGSSPAEYIKINGEDAFRKLETKILAKVGKENGQIVATGGGVVTRPENYDSLAQQGVLVWIKRELAMLEIEGRILSLEQGVDALYQKRKGIYQEFADFSVENKTNQEEQTVREIMKSLEKSRKSGGKI